MNELFNTTLIGELELKNHFVLAPVPSGLVEEGQLKQQAVDFFDTRSKDVGLVIAGAVNIDYIGATNHKKIPYIRTSKDYEIWHEIASVIHKHGTKAIMEIWHSGASRFYTKDFAETKIISPSGKVKNERIGEPLLKSQIEDIVAKFVETAGLAQKAGFDGVDIHAAHGSLLHDFLSKDTNFRNDEYKDGFKVITDIIREIRLRCGQDFTIGLRISNYKMYDLEAMLASNIEGFTQVIKKLSIPELDFFDCSTIKYSDPAVKNYDGSFSSVIKKISNKPTICVGQIGMDNSFYDDMPKILSAILKEPLLNHEELQVSVPHFENYDYLEKKLVENEFDLIALGRPILLNPNWLKDARRNL